MLPNRKFDVNVNNNKPVHPVASAVSPEPHVDPLFLFSQAMLGIFFSAKSAVLIEDVPFTEEDIRNE